MTDCLGFAREVIFRQLFNKYGRPLQGARIIFASVIIRPRDWTLSCF